MLGSLSWISSIFEHWAVSASRSRLIDPKVNRDREVIGRSAPLWKRALYWALLAGTLGTLIVSIVLILR